MPLTILLNASFGPSLVNFRGPLIRALVAAGHSVHASAPDLDAKMIEAVRSLGAVPHDVPLSRAGLNPLRDLAYRCALTRLIRRERIDLVLGYTIKPCIWGSLAAKVSGVTSASLVTGLGYAFGPRHTPLQRVVSLISKALWRRATAFNRVVIFQNPDDRDDFIAAGALADPSKARLVNGSGVDMAHFARRPLPSAPNCLMIARLLNSKGVREYAEAALKLIREGSTARFRLAGYLDNVPDAISAGDLERWVSGGLEYIGPLDDVRPALADSSIFVLPSYREGTPRSVLEAMSMGRPVITTDAPGCRDTTINGKTGLLVPVGDVEATAGALATLIDSSIERERMGEEAWRYCAAKFEVGAVNADMFRHLGIFGANGLDDMYHNEAGRAPT